MASRQVSVFFEPGAPPPVLSLPTCQTNFSYVDIPQPTSIWRQELRRPNLACRRAPSVMWAPDRARSSSPYSRSSSRPAIISLVQDTSESDCRSGRGRSGSPLTEESSDTDSSRGGTPFIVEHEVIPKPPGEVARPKRGGYNLEKAVKWPKSKFERLRV
jgi:hypothetical protein